MQKIYNIIPGVPVYDNSFMYNIFTLIDSVKFYNWIEVNEDIYNCNFLKKHKEFYVLYLDPAGIVKRLFLTQCTEIIIFMKERINYAHCEGVDIAICTTQFDNAVICNHDGQVFLLFEDNM